ncbi:hypothetical protein Bbelb_425300 [Branchiostoma belcheri]|nr:hypothetical protein Bbelb_425300 [Branchiostoma belcheri]
MEKKFSHTAPLVRAQMLCCGHNLCFGCLKRVVECPLCKGPPTRVGPNIAVRNLTSNQTAKCESRQGDCGGRHDRVSPGGRALHTRRVQHHPEIVTVRRDIISSKYVHEIKGEMKRSWTVHMNAYLGGDYIGEGQLTWQLKQQAEKGNTGLPHHPHRPDNNDGAVITIDGPSKKRRRRTAASSYILTDAVRAMDRRQYLKAFRTILNHDAAMRDMVSVQQCPQLTGGIRTLGDTLVDGLRDDAVRRQLKRQSAKLEIGDTFKPNLMTLYLYYDGRRLRSHMEAEQEQHQQDTGKNSSATQQESPDPQAAATAAAGDE